MDAQFDEELIHLAQIGCVSMGIKQSRGSHRVSHVHSHDLCSSSCRQLRYLHVLAVRKRVHHKKSSHFVGYQPVRGWTRWEESELRRNWWRHSSHLSLSLSLSLCFAQSLNTFSGTERLRLELLFFPLSETEREIWERI